MKTTPQKAGAATPVEKDRFDRKKVNTRVSPVINFQIGLIATLVLAFTIIEITNATIIKKQTSTKVRIMDTLDPEEIKQQEYKIVANHPKKVPTAKPEQKVAIIPDNTPEPIQPDPDPDPQPDPEPVNSPVDDSNVTSDDSKKTENKETDPPVNKATTPLTTTMLGLHEMPLFPGCKERYDNAERKDCFNSSIQKFIIRNFDTGLANKLGLEPGSKVNIQIAFTIDVNGVAKDIQVRAPHEELKEEAYRVINKLPTIIPGKVSGDAVNMKFALPLVFRINN